MATRFEVALHGAPEATLRAAAEEALAEIVRLESILSLYKPSSEIAHLNQRASLEPVRVSPEVFTLLERCVDLSQQTQGTFDITLFSESVDPGEYVVDDDVVAPDLVNYRGAILYRLLRVDNVVEDVIVNVYQTKRILCDVTSIGHNRRNRFTDIPHFVTGKRGRI